MIFNVNWSGNGPCCGAGDCHVGAMLLLAMTSLGRLFNILKTEISCPNLLFSEFLTGIYEFLEEVYEVYFG